jgi:hypothetical protein
MSRLTPGDRRAMPASDFAGPGRSYPVENRAHAVLAKAMADRAVATGRMPVGEKQRIDAKANKELGK